LNDIEDGAWDADPLRDRLRALRSDCLPDHDLWPAIAARIVAPAASPAPARTARARLAPWALAASLLLAVLLAWQHNATAPRAAGDRLIASEADAMTREYAGALRVITASAPLDDAAIPGVRDLDRSAAQIRSALARDPGSRFLLDRLQHTYTTRLALTQRAAMS
jgi:hypothetical protein